MRNTIPCVLAVPGICGTTSLSRRQKVMPGALKSGIIATARRANYEETFRLDAGGGPMLRVGSGREKRQEERHGGSQYADRSGTERRLGTSVRRQDHGQVR